MTTPESRQVVLIDHHTLSNIRGQADRDAAITKRMACQRH